MINQKKEAVAVPVEIFPPRDPKGRDNNFNFLRLLLASLVILSHSPELIDGNRNREVLSRVFHTLSFGELAVDGFFLLSGFLIVQSWQRQPNLLDFLRKRVLRIDPAFVLASLVSAFLVGPLVVNLAQYFGHFSLLRFLGGLLFLSPPVVPPVFAGLHRPDINGSMWTISHEFQCYLLVPFLGVLGLVVRRTGFLVVSLLLLVYSVAHTHSHFPFIKSLPNGVLPACFCVGGCFYLFRDEIRYRLSYLLASLVVLILCLYSENTAQFGVATVGAYSLFYFAFADISCLRVFKSHSDVSYGLYLYGWPVQNLLIWYFHHITPLFDCAAALMISYGLGWLSWHLVELPFLRLKPSHDPRDVDANVTPPAK